MIESQINCQNATAKLADSVCYKQPFVKQNLLISFSGGRTSAYMLWWILDNWQNKYNIKVVFANTGKEHEKTFQFINKCSEHFNCEIIWVEAVPNSEKGWAVTHKIVDYKTASRNGEPFENFIRKIGIPSSGNPYCSSILKKAPIENYLKSIGFKKFYTAIGIRIDEVDRVNPNFIKKRIIYPLISDVPTNKKMIDAWWKSMPFKLEIPIGLGNCDNCWKMSMKHLVYNAKNYPESFNWWKLMVDKYGYVKHRAGQLNLNPPFNFYRGNLDVNDIFKLTKTSQMQLSLFAENEKLDGCSESCEAF